MKFKETITDNNDSLNERILSMIFPNQIYHSMEEDAYQYDIEMEYGQQKVAQITKFIIETE